MRRALLVGAGGTVVAVVLLLVLAGVADGRRAEALTPAHTGEALAALEVLDLVVEVRSGEAADWAAGTSGQALAAGDGIRTDADGFAEVFYLDGSRTRLDGSTEFELVELAGDVLAPIIRTRLDVGRTWHRVQGVTGQRGAYEVETAVGTAAVRGTAFTIECDLRPVCTFGVVEGVLLVTTPDGREFVVREDEELTLGIEGAAGAGGAGGADDGGPGDGGPGGGSAGDGSTGDGSTGDDGTAGGGAGGESGSDGQGSASSGSAGSGSTGSGSGGTRGGGSDDGGTTDGSPRPSATGPVVSLGREAVAPGVLAVRPWAATNLELDRATSRYGARREACSVVLNGRNTDLADTPATAIEVPVDGTLQVDALATGPLESYTVRLGFGAASVPAASGDIVDTGDTSRFRGTVDVSRYARWGAGLYEVTARTTGTVCTATAYIDVTGTVPVLTIPGVLALLALLAGLAMLVLAVQQALGIGAAPSAGAGDDGTAGAGGGVA